MNLEKFFNEKNYNEIIQYFSKNKPKTKEEFILLSISYYNLSKLQQALDTLLEAKKQYPNDKEVIFNIIEILYQMGDLNNAVAYIKEGINIEPNNYTYYDILTDYYYINEDFKKAFQMAMTALTFAPIMLKNELINKYFSYFNIQEKLIDEHTKKYDYNVFIKNKEKNLNILMIGSGCHYADSIKYLQELGWNIFVLKTDTWKAFYPNYALLKSMGATIIEKDEIDNFIKINGKNIDVIFRTGYFYGGNELYRNLGTSDIEQLNLFKYIATKIKGINYKAIAILAFDGDTFLTDSFWINWFMKRIKICDYIFTDTENLKEYIVKNTKFDKNKILKFRVEFPNKKDVCIRIKDCYINKVIQIGRYLGDYIPVAPAFIETLNQSLQIGRGDNIKTMTEDRIYFAKKYSDYAFGLGHFYDFYNRNTSFDNCIKSQNFDLIKSSSSEYRYPSIYGFTNIAGKITTYLHFGIIPVIPNDDNDFHRELIDNKLAIGIEKDQYFFDPYDYSNNDIKMIRENILNNLDIFTSDAAYEFINRKVLEIK